MVPVVGAPSQCQLRQVTGTDHNAIDFVGQVHQDLRPLSGLPVLIGDVMHRFILPDIGKMLEDTCRNGYFHPGHTQQFHQFIRIGFCPFCRAEPGHGHGCDTRDRQSQQSERPDRHQQCQRAVQTAGDANDRLAAAYLFQSGCQALRLDPQNCFTALQPSVPILRHKGIGFHGSGQFDGLQRD